jgi:hypothetical protein
MIRVKESPSNNAVLVDIANLGPDMRNGIRHGFFALGKQLKLDVNKEILRKPKGGRTYLVRGPSGRRRRHVASAPGETHANQSGTLRKSLGWKVRGYSTMTFGYGVEGRNPEPKYAAFVENGTSRMKARPSLKLGIKRNLRHADKLFVNSINKQVQP